MKATIEVSRLLLPLAVLLVALQGCGGGGGDSSGPTASPTGDANPAGLWAGGFTAADGVTRSFDVILAPDGRFAGVVASTGLNGRFLIGDGDTTLNAFTATGTVFAQAGEALLPNGQQSAALTMSNGSIVAGQSLKGSYSGAGESALFALGYNGLTSRGASLEAISGVYDVYPPPPVIDTTLTISGGTLTFANDGGCNGAGTIQVIEPRMNIYSWSMLISACSGAEEDIFSGLATLADNPRRGGTGNLIVLYGATENRDRSFVFRGAK
jgi:hypothetical protein